MQNIVSLLVEDPAYASLGEHAAPIEAALRALEEALAKRSALAVPEMQARVTRQAALDAAQRAYNLTLSQLRLLFPGDDALVESYFLALRRASAVLLEDEVAAQMTEN